MNDFQENGEEVEKLCRRLAERQKRLQDAVRDRDSKLCRVVQEQEAWKREMVDHLDRKFREELNKELEK
jgi:hypothetical protein